MPAGDSITAVDSVSTGTTTIQPSSGDVWKVTSALTQTNTFIRAYDGTNVAGNVFFSGEDADARTSQPIWFADNSEYLQWNNSGCSAEVNAYSGQKVVE